ncbi:MAG: glycosyltransferase family 4 protein [Leptolyngbya sp. SIO4C1]|nr:glycosyltransferase family 4 protein [Leptolyngbya sp. SIO4C1]
MKVLFLDQSGKLGGAELCLADIAEHFKQTSLVGVFDEGTFPQYLRQLEIPVKIFNKQTLQVQKASSLLAGLKSLNQLIPLAAAIAQCSRQYDLIYANTQKALVVGALSSLLSRRPLVYHLHDIVSPEHFSRINRRIIITLANRAVLIIANSQASRDAFIQAGGRADCVHVVYNGFRSEDYANSIDSAAQRQLRSEVLSLDSNQSDDTSFIVGHFSRLSPWKGQHVLIEALQYCPENVTALLVGDALFGEQDYVQQLRQQVKSLKLENRVKFLGFRSDIPQLMSACDLVAHTSTAPEPFGRVIVEAMLCGTPVVAAAAGGAIELVDPGRTGWLTPPGDAKALAEVITTCQNQPDWANVVADQAKAQAVRRFNLETVNADIARLLGNIKQQKR